MAAPEAMVGALGRKGVGLGTSLSSFPTAPGAPSGQRRIGALVWACASRAEARRKRKPKRTVAGPNQSRFVVPASADQILRTALNNRHRDRLKPGLQTLLDKRCIKEGVKLFKDVVLIKRQMLREQEHDSVLVRVHVEGRGGRAAPAKLPDSPQRICFGHVEPNGPAEAESV